MNSTTPHSRIWLIRGLSLLLAVVIWLFVELEQQDEAELAATVRDRKSTRLNSSHRL